MKPVKVIVSFSLLWHIDSLFVVELRSTLTQIWMDILEIRFIGVGVASKFTLVQNVLRSC